MKNKHINFVLNLLDEPVKGRERRIRDKVAAVLIKAAEETEKERVKLAKENAVLDKKGKPIIENNAYKLKDADNFNKELKVLMDEEVEIPRKSYFKKKIKDASENRALNIADSAILNEIAKDMK